MTAENGGTTLPQPGKSHYGHLFRLLHWVLTAAFVLLLLTGLSLNAISRPDRSFFSGVLPEYLWSGHVHLWHFGTALVFCPSLLATVLVCPRRVWSRPINAMLLGGGLVMIGTGLVMHGGIVSGEIGKLTVWLHSSLALMLLPFAFLWHTVMGLTRRLGLLIPAFHPFAQPQWGRLLIFLVLTPLAMWLMLGGWPLVLPGRTLVAAAISPEESASGDVARLPWDRARPLIVPLVNGNGLDAGQTEVTLRALHNGDELFLLAEWNDPTEERRYTPWKKTADGWEHLKTNPKDESVYYEDKFGLMFPVQPDWRFEQAGCALYCHAGGGNPYGVKYSDRVVDEWHWKAVRSDPVGQADDRYVSHSASETKLSGRRNDPEPPGGGYKPNAAPDQPHPSFLPGDPADTLLGAIRKEHAVPYTEERAAAIPPGTIIPGMICTPFGQDRGDLKCQSTHRDGRWSLLFRRKLDTGSEFDVQFKPGGSSAFSCAAFDHTSKRHAYSLAVFRLVIP
ncbi:MAG: hypothetical protein GX575_03770 [Candidatus Anammoximicrobium sp.]|nr:hypothetical protein [Candidatus Anammoximicrobium sp.]